MNPVDTFKSIMRSDGWQNILAGLGAKTKKGATAIAPAQLLHERELETIYLGEGLGARIVDIIPEDATRKGLELSCERPEDELALRTALDSLRLMEVAKNAYSMTRLYGGALIIPTALDGSANLAQPLNIARVKKVERLTVVPAPDVEFSSSQFQTDPTKERFGLPITYSVTFHLPSSEVTLPVHYTRAFPIFGRMLPRRVAAGVTASQKYFGLSALQGPYDALRDFGGVHDSVVNVMYEFVIGKITVEGLANMLAAGEEKKLLTRMEIIGLMKSVINMVILDSNETYTRDSVSLAGVPEVLDRFAQKLAAETGIPVTKLWGRSPAGLNATGESDLTMYYDMVDADRKEKLTEAINGIIDLVALSLKIENYQWAYKPIYQLTEKEEAEVEKLEAEKEKVQAETWKTYIDAGVYDPETVREYIEGEEREEDLLLE